MKKAEFPELAKWMAEFRVRDLREFLARLDADDRHELRQQPVFWQELNKLHREMKLLTLEGR